MKMNVVAGLLVMTVTYGLLVERADAATVMVTSSPSRAEVTIDGKVRGKTPLRLKLEEGLHDLTLTSDDCMTHVERINIGTQLLHHSVVMKPKTYPVDVMFTDPDEVGWAVFDGERLMMAGPKLIKLPTTLQLSKGRHQLRFMKSGFKDIPGTVTVDPAQENQCMELASKPRKGYSSYGRCRLALVVGKWDDDEGRYLLLNSDMTGDHKDGRGSHPGTYTLEETDDEIHVCFVTPKHNYPPDNQKLLSYDRMDGPTLHLHRVKK